MFNTINGTHTIDIVIINKVKINAEINIKTNNSNTY